jgi:hypothetical protein
MSRSERVFVLLTRAYPKRFRADFQDEMFRLFREQLRDARSGGRREFALLWLRVLTDVVQSAPAEHLRERTAQARTTEGVSMTVRSPADFTAARRAGYAVAAIPVISSPVYLLATGAAETVTSNPPEILGLPAGIAVLALSIIWALFAYPFLRLTSSAAGLMAPLLVFTFPATLTLLISPVVILTLLNLNV